ncbi:MAG: hypothetical protein IPL47_09725 [Phyllobacteriaceae bacterium]|nr:hypothetical protein [Phyllobacteriaceae bacterium]
MTKIEKLEMQVAALDAEELRAFGEWFDELRASMWDRQIEADSIAGKHDALAARVLAEFDAGMAAPLNRKR